MANTFEEAEIDEFYQGIQEYLYQQKIKDAGDVVRAGRWLIVHHFRSIQDLRYRHPGEDVRQWTPFVKVGQAARLLVQRGLPKSWAPRYMDPAMPAFDAEEGIGSDTDIPAEYLKSMYMAEEFTMGAIACNTIRVAPRTHRAQIPKSGQGGTLSRADFNSPRRH